MFRTSLALLLSAMCLLIVDPAAGSEDRPDLLAVQDVTFTFILGSANDAGQKASLYFRTPQDTYRVLWIQDNVEDDATQRLMTVAAAATSATIWQVDRLSPSGTILVALPRTWIVAKLRD